MANKKQEWVWVYKPVPPKFTPNQKKDITDNIKKIIKETTKLSSRVSRIDMKANRIYLYALIEQYIPEGIELAKSLIEGKYREYPYARITLKDSKCTKCTVDWQRHNEQWMTLYEGTLSECISGIEKDSEWFD